jgi:quercetin dioxygenase-like cupin family protein
MPTHFTTVSKKFNQDDLQSILDDLGEKRLLNVPLSIRQDWIFTDDCDYITKLLNLEDSITAIAYMQFNPGVEGPVHMDYLGSTYDKYALLIPVKGCAGLRMDWHKHKDANFTYKLPPPEGVVPFMDRDDAETIDTSDISSDYIIAKIDTWHSVTNTGTEVAHLLSIRFFDTDPDHLASTLQQN